MSKGPLWNGQGKLKLSQSHGLLLVTDIQGEEFEEYFWINVALQGSECRKVGGKPD